MDWTQIETKWAAMTRRVRADWPLGIADKAPGTIAVPRTVTVVEQGTAAHLSARRADAGSSTLTE